MYPDIILAAGEAFGSGAHPSTVLALQALDGVAASGRHITRVLDVGCGSGVLAIAAAQRFVQAQVVATDINARAPEFTLHNAALNGVEGRIMALRADGVAHPAIIAGGTYDLIVCNIALDTLAAMLGRMTPLLAPDGLLVASGIQQHQCTMLEETLAQASLSTHGIIGMSGWVCALAGHQNTITMPNPSAPAD